MYTPALVIQQNATVFVQSSGASGQIMLIPTPSSNGKVDGDFWASPVVGRGIVGTGFKYTPCQPGDAVGPDVQSFHVFRLITSNESTDWYVVGTSTQYIATSVDAESTHASPPVLLPQSVAVFVPTQDVCNQDRTGKYFATMAAPSPLGTGKYFAKGWLNGVALPALSNAGYTTSGLFLAALNASWGAVGVWTKTADDITFTATQNAGTGNDVFTGGIYLI